VGATVIGVGDRPEEWLDDELRGWLQHYHQIPSVTDAGALRAAVEWIQGKVWVDRLEATIESHIMPTAEVREALTGEENLVMVGRLYGMKRREAKARAAELLKGKGKRRDKVD